MRGRKKSKRARAMHVTGNLLIAAAVLALSWVWLTDLAGGVLQQHVRREAPSFLAGPLPPEDGKGTRLDFSGRDRELAYWDELPAGGAFGRIVSVKMGMDRVVVKGTGRTDLAKGPGWIVTTDLPGSTGNVGISGHRTTFGAPFSRIDLLEAGDIIDLYSPFRRYRYVVDDSRVVTPDRVDVVAHTGEPMLTLTACHPRYSARYRIVVRARLVDARPVAR